MSNNSLYNQNQLRDYSTLFSRSEALSWMKLDFESINCKIKRYDEQWKQSKKATYIDYLRHIYNILEENYQNEYIFKNSFLNEWLIKEMGQSNSKVFSEYRVGNAVADLVMFNGNSKVFEIKTDLDTKNRLALQIQNYKKAFNQIYLIIPETKIDTYRNYDVEIGLITFNNKRTDKFKLYRKAFNNQTIEADTIMHILHTHEYKAIVKSHFGDLPEMTSFNQFHICREFIKKIPNEELNKYFIDIMKERDLENILSSRNYREFNQLSLALKLSKTEKKNMIQILKSPLNS